MDTCSNRFLKFVLALAILCGLSGCTPTVAEPTEAGAEVLAPPVSSLPEPAGNVGFDASHKLGMNANYAYAVGFGASTVPWASGYTAPTINQTAAASTSAGSGAAGQGMSVTAQAGQAATGGTNAGGLGGSLTLAPGQGGTSGGGTNGSPGAINLNLSSALAGATQSFVNVQVGGVTQASLGYLVGSTTQSALYLLPGGTAPSSTNYSFREDGSGDLVLNAPTGTLYFSVAGSVVGDFTSGAFAFAVPIGGYSNTPVLYRGQVSPNTVACGTGGTQTISAAQSAAPFFVVSGGTLTSDCVLDFSTNASGGGIFEVGILTASFVLNGHNLSIKNGTTTLSYAALPTHNLIDVRTFGTNNVVVSP